MRFVYVRFPSEFPLPHFWLTKRHRLRSGCVLMWPQGATRVRSNIWFTQSDPLNVKRLLPRAWCVFRNSNMVETDAAWRPTADPSEETVKAPEPLSAGGQRTGCRRSPALRADQQNLIVTPTFWVSQKLSGSAIPTAECERTQEPPCKTLQNFSG